MFTLVPMVLGAFFDLDINIKDAAWQDVANSTEAKIRWLVPLVPALGTFVFIIKVLMIASVRGRD